PSLSSSFLLLVILRPPRPTLFPYTTLFRSEPWLVVHLGMSGRFTVTDAEEPRAPHTHVVWTLDNSQELRFRDPRRFGSVSYYAKDRKSTRLNSSHRTISYAVFCLKKKKK